MSIKDNLTCQKGKYFKSQTQGLKERENLWVEIN